MSQKAPKLVPASQLLWIVLSVGLLAGVGLLVIIANRKPTVPAWFNYDPANPYGIFDAWKHLTTRRAAVVCGGDWMTVGGILTDNWDRPIPMAPLRFETFGRRPVSVDLVTDSNGCFIVYGAANLEISLPPGKPPVWLGILERLPQPIRSLFGRKNSFIMMIDSKFTYTSACPGYPDSQAGREFAASRKEMRYCKPKLLMKAADRAFYHLQVTKENGFTSSGFNRFQKESMLDDRTNVVRSGSSNWLTPLQARQGSTERRAPNLYKILILDPEGKPLPGVTVAFSSYDGYEDNHQTVESNEQGETELEEWLLTGKALEHQGTNYFGQVQRAVTVYAGRFGSGPVHPAWQTNGVTIIQLRPCAGIAGKVVDENGSPISTTLCATYNAKGWQPGENEIHVKPDGTFFFDQIMPEEPVHLVESWRFGVGAANAPIKSAPFSLNAGETRSNILIQVRQGGAIRGIVVNTRDEPVKAWQIGFEVDGRPQFFQEGDKFGIQGVGEEPLRIHIRAKDHLEYLSAPIKLEPGEVRFVKAVLQINPGKLAVKPLRAWLEDLDKFGGEPYEWAETAVRKLGTNALPELLRLLQSADWHEQHLSLNGFKALGTSARPAVSGLFRMLQGEQTKEQRPFREGALHALTEIKAEESVVVIISLIEHDADDRVRATAIWALGRVGKRPDLAIPVITNVLAGGREEFRVSCVYALGDFGTNSQPALPLVLKVLEDESAFTRSYASNALRQINPAFAKAHGVQ